MTKHNKPSGSPKLEPMVRVIPTTGKIWRYRVNITVNHIGLEVTSPRLRITAGGAQRTARRLLLKELRKRENLTQRQAAITDSDLARPAHWPEYSGLDPTLWDPTIDGYFVNHNTGRRVTADFLNSVTMTDELLAALNRNIPPRHS